MYREQRKPQQSDMESCWGLHSQAQEEWQSSPQESKCSWMIDQCVPRLVTAASFSNLQLLAYIDLSPRLANLCPATAIINPQRFWVASDSRLCMIPAFLYVCLSSSFYLHPKPGFQCTQHPVTAEMATFNSSRLSLPVLRLQGHIAFMFLHRAFSLLFRLKAYSQIYN